MALMCIVSAMAMICSPVVMASSKTTLTVSSVTAEPGTEVEVAIDLSGNEVGILGMMVSVSYDENLTLKKATAGNALPSLDFTPGKSLKENPINFAWDGLDADYGNGTVAILTFAVPEDAQGKYDINISYTTGNIYDNTYNDIDVAVVNGSITVNSVPVITEPSMSCDNIVNGADNITLDINLISPNEIIGKVYVALYDENRMTMVKVYEADEFVNATLDAVNGNCIKVMWWDNNHKPITEHLKIEL
ncbi:MAG: hypothetical protein IKV86_08180 [Clostridia bacterium]|nr:hypothetical protein [Clostridia bacterium]